MLGFPIVLPAVDVSVQQVPDALVVGIAAELTGGEVVVIGVRLLVDEAEEGPLGLRVDEFAPELLVVKAGRVAGLWIVGEAMELGLDHVFAGNDGRSRRGGREVLHPE